MSKNYAALAQQIVAALGGVDNVVAVTPASPGDTMLYRKPVPQNHGEFHLISQEIKKYDLSVAM
jgi:hypothetical protein